MSLNNLPTEILEEIILDAVTESLIGPPREIVSILTACRTLYSKLSPHTCPRLYARIFMLKFDPPNSTWASGRVGDSKGAPLSPHLTHELLARFTALRLFSTGDLDNPRLPDALMTAFVMILENTSRNAAQLRHAKLSLLLGRFLREKIGAGSHSRHDWPAQNPSNSAALFLFWALTSECKHPQTRLSLSLSIHFSIPVMVFANITLPKLIANIAAEDDQTRKEVMKALTPAAFAAFRVCTCTEAAAWASACAHGDHRRQYPCSSLPEHQFRPGPFRNDALTQMAQATSTAIAVPPPPREMPYLGCQIYVQPPPLAYSAILSFFARVERRKIEIPEFIPRTRAEAAAMGIRGATQEDVIEYRDLCHTKLPGRDAGPSDDTIDSSGLDLWWADRRRSVFRSTLLPRVPHTGAYLLGSLNGQWAGSVLVSFCLASCCVIRY